MSAERKEMKVLLSLPPDSIPDVVVRGEHIERDAPLCDTLHAAATTGYELFGRIDDMSREIRDKPKLAAAVLPHVERAARQFEHALAHGCSLRAALDKELEQIEPLKPIVESFRQAFRLAF
jgi:hypothetical protein